MGWCPLAATVQITGRPSCTCVVQLQGLPSTIAEVVKKVPWTVCGLQPSAVFFVFAECPTAVSTTASVLGSQLQLHQSTLLSTRFVLLLCTCLWSCLLLLISTCYEGRPVKLAAAAAARGGIAGNTVLQAILSQLV